MLKLSPDAKEAIVKKALNRGDKTLKAIAELNNIGESTLSTWMKLYRKKYSSKNQTAQNSFTNLSFAERFDHIVATYSLDETELGEYCRRHGLYGHELTTWKKELSSMKDSTKDTKLRVELTQLKKENKRLTRELHYKEKALAEASALLVLKKKAALIWGVSEAD